MVWVGVKNHRPRLAIGQQCEHRCAEVAVFPREEAAVMRPLAKGGGHELHIAA